MFSGVCRGKDIYLEIYPLEKTKRMGYMKAWRRTLWQMKVPEK